MIRRRLLASCAGVLAAVAIAAVLNRPPVAPNTRPLVVPVTTRLRLWRQVERCTGRTGDPWRVHFRVWADTTSAPMGVGGLPAEEAYIHTTGEIVLLPRNAGDSAWLMHGMGHALAGWNDGRHDPSIGRRCSHLFRWP